MARQPSSGFVAAILIGVTAIGNAAEIRTIGFGDTYQVRIVGRVDPGDHDRLLSVVAEKGRYPEAVHLESGGGDVAEGMKIGRYARRAMLPVAAGKKCDGACFLIWAGGVNRTARAPMNIQLPAADSGQVQSVRDYLHDMEVADGVVEEVFGAGTKPVPPGELVAAIGREPPGYRRWLSGQCGELTDRQVRDRQAIEALKAMENAMANMSMGGGSMYALDPETQERAARAQTFSREYRDEIDGAYAKFKTCRKDAIAGAR